MVRMWETTDSFPFRTLRGLGGTLLAFGISLIVLGAFDVIWTVVHYTDQYKDCPDDWDENLEDPCKHDDLTWTWTAEGVWGGFLILLVGILGLIFSRWRVRSLRLQKDMFGMGCILLIFPICPAIIALSVLELYYGVDIFYYTEDNDLIREDLAKFVVPLLTGFVAFLTWIIAIAGASVVCCCSKIGVTETVYNKQAPAGPLVIQQPQQQQPIIVAQQQKPQLLQIAAPEPAPQTTQYEVVAIAQPPPPPYFVSSTLGMPPPGMGPMGMPPPGMGPMGPPMMGPPMMGPPMMGPPMMGPPMMGPPFRGPPPPGPFGPRRFGPPPPMLMPPEPYL